MATSSASLDRSPRKNWLESSGQSLPPYVRQIARSIEREQAVPLSRAVSLALGAVKRWARGGGDVNADTRAKAAAAVAHWEKAKAANKARQVKTSNHLSRADAVDLAADGTVMTSRNTDDGLVVLSHVTDTGRIVELARYVRTPAGARRYGRPVGALISDGGRTRSGGSIGVGGGTGRSTGSGGKAGGGGRAVSRGAAPSGRTGTAGGAGSTGRAPSKAERRAEAGRKLNRWADQGRAQAQRREAAKVERWKGQQDGALRSRQKTVAREWLANQAKGIPATDKRQRDLRAEQNAIGTELKRRSQSSYEGRPQGAGANATTADRLARMKGTEQSAALRNASDDELKTAASELRGRTAGGKASPTLDAIRAEQARRTGGGERPSKYRREGGADELQAGLDGVAADDARLKERDRRESAAAKPAERKTTPAKPAPAAKGKAADDDGLVDAGRHTSGVNPESRARQAAAPSGEFDGIKRLNDAQLKAMDDALDKKGGDPSPRHKAIKAERARRARGIGKIEEDHSTPEKSRQANERRAARTAAEERNQGAAAAPAGKPAEQPRAASPLGELVAASPEQRETILRRLSDTELVAAADGMDAALADVRDSDADYAEQVRNVIRGRRGEVEREQMRRRVAQTGGKRAEAGGRGDRAAAGASGQQPLTGQTEEALQARQAVLRRQMGRAAAGGADADGPDTAAARAEHTAISRELQRRQADRAGSSSSSSSAPSGGTKITPNRTVAKASTTAPAATPSSATPPTLKPGERVNPSVVGRRRGGAPGGRPMETGGRFYPAEQRRGGGQGEKPATTPPSTPSPSPTGGSFDPKTVKSGDRVMVRHPITDQVVPAMVTNQALGSGRVGVRYSDAPNDAYPVDRDRIVGPATAAQGGPKNTAPEPERPLSELSDYTLRAAFENHARNAKRWRNATGAGKDEYVAEGKALRAEMKRRQDAANSGSSGPAATPAAKPDTPTPAATPAAAPSSNPPGALSVAPAEDRATSIAQTRADGSGKPHWVQRKAGGRGFLVYDTDPGAGSTKIDPKPKADTPAKPATAGSSAAGSTSGAKRERQTFTATAPNGEVVTRGSQSKDYTHMRSVQMGDGTWLHTFHTSEALAKSPNPQAPKRTPQVTPVKAEAAASGRKTPDAGPASARPSTRERDVPGTAANVQARQDAAGRASRSGQRGLFPEDREVPKTAGTLFEGPGDDRLTSAQLADLQQKLIRETDPGKKAALRARIARGRAGGDTKTSNTSTPGRVIDMAGFGGKQAPPFGKKKTAQDAGDGKSGTTHADLSDAQLAAAIAKAKTNAKGKSGKAAQAAAQTLVKLKAEQRNRRGKTVGKSDDKSSGKPPWLKTSNAGGAALDLSNTGPARDVPAGRSAKAAAALTRMGL